MQPHPCAGHSAQPRFSHAGLPQQMGRVDWPAHRAPAAKRPQKLGVQRLCVGESAIVPSSAFWYFHFPFCRSAIMVTLACAASRRTLHALLTLHALQTSRDNPFAALDPDVPLSSPQEDLGQARPAPPPGTKPKVPDTSGAPIADGSIADAEKDVRYRL